MRTQVTECLLLNSPSDPLVYLDATKFRPTFDHLSWITTAYNRLNRARRGSETVKHHSKEYGGKYPLWVVAEVMDFSDISKLYEGLPSAKQRLVAEELGIKIDLSQLTSNQIHKLNKTSPGELDGTIDDCPQHMCTPRTALEQIILPCTDTGTSHQ